jgi:C1A family cysteine protease
MKPSEFESFRVLMGLLLTGVFVDGAIAGAQGDALSEQQVAEPKLVRPDDVEHQFEVPKPMSFDEYCAKFGKQYAAESERLMRQKIYLATLAMALRSQVAYLLGAQDYFLGPTPFSDRTRKEKSRVCLSCFANRSEDEGRRAARESAQDENQSTPVGESFAGGNRQNGLPLRASQAITRTGAGSSSAAAGVDLRYGNCLGPVKDQINCDACHAFAVIAALEYMSCLYQTRGVQVSFSEQYIIDCGNEGYGLKRCSGGDVYGTIMFIAEWGVYYANQYPYTGLEDDCRYPDGYSSSPLRLGSAHVNRVHISEWARLLMNNIPIIVNTRVSGSLHFNYLRGVMVPTPGTNEDAHIMLLVGIMPYSRGYYYILRNSWGSNWGESGYWYISTEAANCFFDHGYVPAGLDPQRPDARIFSRPQPG